MARLYHVAIILLSSIFLFSGCGGQNSSESTPVSAHLWQNGQWALYDLNRLDTEGVETKGTLKISSVGSEQVDGQPYFWLELREDSENGVEITKFLAKEKADYNPENGFTFWDDVKRIIIQKDTNRPEEVPVQHLRRYSPHFIENSGSRKFGNVENNSEPVRETIDPREFTVNGKPVKVSGHRNVQHFTSTVNLGFLNLEDTTDSSVEYFQSNDLPFGGIVSVNFSSITTSVNKLKPDAQPKKPKEYRNSMQLKSYGLNAESQIIGTPTEMKVMPFPFLEAARKSSKTK